MSVTGNAINATIPTDVDTIPPLPASKITSGQFSTERIPDLDAGKTTTGIFPIARGGTGANNAADARNNLGLGNVPNVTTDDQAPTYTAATTLTNLTSGEKLSVAFGKLAKAVMDLIDHIGNKNNPHEVTAAQTGAAAASHTHNASDINAGTLSSDRLPTVPITKGGTGATTASAARTNLGITLANIGAAAASHTHNASDINAGTLSSDRLPTVPITKGGTGATTAANARTNLGITPTNIGAAPASHTHEQYYDSETTRAANTVLAAPNGSNGIAVFRKLVSADIPTVPITKGGTGATSASAARTNLGITPANIGAARIESGSYVGTGTYGRDNPNSLTFGFVPKVVIIVNNDPYQLEGGTVFLYGQTGSSWIGLNFNGGSDCAVHVSWNGNTVSWYNTSGDDRQLNNTGFTYYWCAIS